MAFQALAACARLKPPPPNVESSELAGPSPRLNTTPMAAALSCLQKQGATPATRIGVSDFVDGTGAIDGGTQNSRAFTQRPDMMMVVALANAGAPLVNRSSVNVAEWEMGKAMEKKLGDGRTVVVDDQKINYRPIKTGTILGSTHYITGAVTELNWNIDSKVAEGGAFGGFVGKRTYRISIAVDVVVTDTQSTEIVFAKSYKKQLVGFETNANFFRFVNRAQAVALASLGTAPAAASAAQALEVFEANLGEKQNEPTQTALRWVIEVAAYDIIRHLARKGESCNRLLPPGSLDSYNPIIAQGEDPSASKPGGPQAPGARGDVADAKAEGASRARRKAISDAGLTFDADADPANARGSASRPANPDTPALPRPRPGSAPAMPRFSDLSAEMDATFARGLPDARQRRNDIWPYGGMQPARRATEPATAGAASTETTPPETTRVPKSVPATASTRAPEAPRAAPPERSAAVRPDPAAPAAQPAPPAPPPPQQQQQPEQASGQAAPGGMWMDGAVPAPGIGFTRRDEAGS